MPDLPTAPAAAPPGDLAAASRAECEPAGSRSLEGRMHALRFVRRVWRLCLVGLTLGSLAVAAVFAETDAAPGWWALLAAYALAWPHVAFALARRSADPVRCERASLTLDSLLGGVWVAAMHFALLPSALVLTMLSADKVGVGGPRFLLRTSAGLALACALTSAALGFPVGLDTPLWVEFACVPLLVAYPLLLSSALHALARKYRRQNQDLVRLGRTDGLTGLANRRQCLEDAGRELARHLRSGEPTTLMIADVDHFKRANDRYGHPAGDRVLATIARVLRENCRAVDTVGRHGGDEFMLVLPGTGIDAAAEVAARIRSALAAAAVPGIPAGACTLSIGAAEAAGEVGTLDAWITRADAALYRAKEAGRDRFVAAGTGSGDSDGPARDAAGAARSSPAIKRKTGTPPWKPGSSPVPPSRSPA